MNCFSVYEMNIVFATYGFDQVAYLFKNLSYFVWPADSLWILMWISYSIPCFTAQHSCEQLKPLDFIRWSLSQNESQSWRNLLAIYAQRVIERRAVLSTHLVAEKLFSCVFNQNKNTHNIFWACHTPTLKPQNIDFVFLFILHEICKRTLSFLFCTSGDYCSKIVCLCLFPIQYLSS